MEGPVIEENRAGRKKRQEQIRVIYEDIFFTQ
jgi:hypothetical protein